MCEQYKQKSNLDNISKLRDQMIITVKILENFNQMGNAVEATEVIILTFISILIIKIRVDFISGNHGAQ